ncbi:unnamed protein product [Gongylonema pulchrum]|uniref:tyrosine--tRNA ligase n=1 Tax=Gongylonema pulchrum TaxID=637853 RepID=A0A183E1A2_9BILA|nr:unnamed protein product [Gongylonema pulchrum]
MVKEDRLIIGESWLKDGLKKDKTLQIVYSIAPKGRFHLGFVVPLLKLKKLQSLKRVSMTIILADVDAFLDNEKCAWNVREARCDYYTMMLHQIFALLNLKDIKIIRSSSYQLEPKYTLELYQVASIVTRDEAALLEGVNLASLLSPLYFAIDHYHLDIDIVILGEDMRPYAEFAEKVSRHRGQRPRAQILLPVLPSISGRKMSASDPEFHLDLLDSPKQIKQKVARSFCEPGNLANNIAFELAKYFVLPLLDSELTIERSEENGGNVRVSSCAELERIIVSGCLHPADLKAAVVSEINRFCDPIREHFSSRLKLISAAFPNKKRGKK